MTGTISPSIPTIGQPNSTEDADVKSALETLRDGLNAILGSSNKVNAFEEGAIKRENLAATAQYFRWYTPKVIATEQSTEEVGYVTLSTADEIKEVVLPENGIMVVFYSALWKETAAPSKECKARIYLGSNGLKNLDGNIATVGCASESFRPLITAAGGLINGTEAASIVTTGQTMFSLAGTTTEGVGNGGGCFIKASPGTYNVSVKFTGGGKKVTVKERSLHVITYG